MARRSIVMAGHVPTIAQKKKELRASLCQRRAQAAQNNPGAALAVRDLFLSGFSLPAQACVGFYMAQGDELDAAPLAQALSERGHSLCLPVVETRNAPLVFRAYGRGDTFRLGPFGIYEPQLTSPLARPDFLLVPMVGFDRACHRLGQGGGYYDRTIPLLRNNESFRAIGLAFAAQEEPCLPAEVFDALLDAVVTEKEIIRGKSL